MNFSDPDLNAKYHRLGFKSEGLGLELRIGNLQLSAAEHPWKGVVVIFTYITPRTMAQFDIAVPKRCSVEQIAALIHLNIATNFREEVESCKRHFQSLCMPIYQ